jgi:SAM-dependent methyltransferase
LFIASDPFFDKFKTLSIGFTVVYALKQTSEKISPSYWDWVAENSFHIKMKHQTITDIFYRYIVLAHILDARPENLRWLLKLDAYNEATHTQYGFYLMDGLTELVLVDISGGIVSKAVEKAVKRGVYNMTHPVVADFRKMPLRDGAVDMSCSFGSIEHVPDYDRAFYEQARVVRDGGKVLVGVPNLANWSMRALSATILHALGLMEKITNPERHFTGRQVKALAECMGLVNVEVTGYHLFPKHLRWLDLWLAYRGVRIMHRSRFLLWLLKAFTYMEFRHRHARVFAEMLLVKGVKVWGRGKGGKSLQDVEHNTVKSVQST